MQQTAHPRDEPRVIGRERRDRLATGRARGRGRRVDLAEVNGQVFVNNVSLGLYAEAVQRPGYREAKIRTLLDTIPDALGSGARGPRLFYDGRVGKESAAAVLVSNDPYRLG